MLQALGALGALRALADRRFTATLAVLAQPDLHEHEAGREYHPDTDQRKREHLTRTTANQRTAQDTRDYEQSCRTEGGDASARRHP